MQRSKATGPGRSGTNRNTDASAKRQINRITQSSNLQPMYEYLIIAPNAKPFYTNWVSDELMPPDATVINLLNDTFSRDGVTWEEIDEDHL